MKILLLITIILLLIIWFQNKRISALERKWFIDYSNSENSDRPNKGLVVTHMNSPINASFLYKEIVNRTFGIN